jgi:hypothetical protein
MYENNIHYNYHIFQKLEGIEYMHHGIMYSHPGMNHIHLHLNIYSFVDILNNAEYRRNMNLGKHARLPIRCIKEE